MDNRTKKETRLRRLSSLVWRVFVLEWTLALMIAGYLILLDHIQNDLKPTVLMCSDIEDFAKIPMKYRKLCPKGEPK